MASTVQGVFKEEKSSDLPPLDSLTTAEKIGQLFIFAIAGPNISNETLEELKQLQPGGVLIMGNLSRTDVLQMTTRIKSVPFKVPPFIAIDQEGGTVKRFAEDEVSHPASLAAHPEKVCSETRASSRWLRDLGVNVNFGIVADIAWEPEMYIAPRAYGNNPEIVSAIVKDKVKCSESLLTTVKHFPGHGRTIENSHFTLPTVDIDYPTWGKSDRIPFKTAVDETVDIIMTGHLTFPEIATEPASLSKRWIQEIRKLGFNGVIVTDDLGMLEQSGYTTEQTVREALRAGNDMLLYSDTTATYGAVLLFANSYKESGNISDEQLKERLERIYNLKKDLE